MFIDFIERGKGREKRRKRDRHGCERETWIGCPKWVSNPQPFGIQDDNVINRATMAKARCQPFLCPQKLHGNVNGENIGRTESSPGVQ